MVTVIWETWLKSGAEQEGLTLTRRIWHDMRGFDGYIGHQLLRDVQEVGHLIVVSQWESLELADRLRAEYADHEPARKIGPLLARPRNRWVLEELQTDE
jgi:heme-degrading monooxygenase HmoA